MCFKFELDIALNYVALPPNQTPDAIRWSCHRYPQQYDAEPRCVHICWYHVVMTGKMQSTNACLSRWFQYLIKKEAQHIHRTLLCSFDLVSVFVDSIDTLCANHHGCMELVYTSLNCRGSLNPFESLPEWTGGRNYGAEPSCRHIHGIQSHTSYNQLWLDSETLYVEDTQALRGLSSIWQQCHGMRTKWLSLHLPEALRLGSTSCSKIRFSWLKTLDQR